jgi:hypothetical protein
MSKKSVILLLCHPHEPCNLDLDKKSYHSLKYIGPPYTVKEPSDLVWVSHVGIVKVRSVLLWLFFL